MQAANVVLGSAAYEPPPPHGSRIAVRPILQNCAPGLSAYACWCKFTTPAPTVTTGPPSGGRSGSEYERKNMPEIRNVNSRE